MQGAKLAESSRQWKPAPLWLEEKPKLALEAVLGSGGAESIVGVGGASVSMLKVVGSKPVAPPRSLCSARAVYVPGISGGAASTEYRPSAPDGEERLQRGSGWAVAGVDLDGDGVRVAGAGAGGAAEGRRRVVGGGVAGVVRVTVGAAASMLSLACGALSLPAASRALTWKVWVPSASVL